MKSIASKINVFFNAAALSLISLIFCSFTASAGVENGHEWVDLGLPSGTKWATCNLGANQPQEYGTYFAWGEINPTSKYIRENCENYGKNFQWLLDNGYVDENGNLNPSHDAARQNWGGSWAMPSFKEIKELLRNTKKEWKTINGNKGLVLTSIKNGNSIFLPAAGWKLDNSRNDVGSIGHYWSSTVEESDPYYAILLTYEGNTQGYMSNHRYWGYSIRPVLHNELTQSENAVSANGTINGHEYVDLGLPSGLKWATSNVGTSSPEDNGSYFAWGETRTKSSYTKGNCETYGKDFQWLCDNGYVDKNGNLSLSHDAARQNWGGTWRMPTNEEFEELINNTTTEWTKRNGINGRLIKSKKNGNSIFLPASGQREDFSLTMLGEYGYIWSSTVYPINTGYIYYLRFSENSFRTGTYYSYFGFTVRPVSE